MATPNLTDADRAELVRILPQTIDADRFPRSPRVQRWTALLGKLAPEPPAAAEPYLPPRAWINSTIAPPKGRRQSNRKSIPEDVQHRVLDRCRRRCALCAHFDHDYGRKEGQIAHIDRDPSNVDEDALVYLCLPHHDDYDTTRRQTKNLTEQEVKTARDRLYDFIDHGGVSTGRQPPTGRRADRKTLAGILARMATVPDYFLTSPNFGGCSFSGDEIDAFRAVVEKQDKPEQEFIDEELEELRWRFVNEGQVLVHMIDSRLRPAPQPGWYRLPIEWRESAPDRLDRVAESLNEQAAKTGTAYYELVRAARKKLEN